jgi:hypothetical protein
MNRRAMLSLVVLLASLLAVACGSDSPSGSSGPGTVSVQGMVLGSSAGVGPNAPELTASSADSARKGKILVTVAGTTITAEVAANGTFEIKGVPAGSFLLIFTVDGVEIGRVDLVAAEGSEVKITVQIESSQLVVIEIKVDTDDDDDGAPTTNGCFINGGKVGRDIELEGQFASGAGDLFTMLINGGRGTGTVTVHASTAAYKCNGNKANDCKANLGPSSKLHVRGALNTCSTSAADVTAYEVKVQKD